MIPSTIARCGIAAMVASCYLVVASMTHAADSASQPRKTTNINAFWKYRPGDVAGARSGRVRRCSVAVGRPAAFVQHTLLPVLGLLRRLRLVSETLAVAGNDGRQARVARI